MGQCMFWSAPIQDNTRSAASQHFLLQPVPVSQLVALGAPKVGPAREAVYQPELSSAIHSCLLELTGQLTGEWKRLNSSRNKRPYSPGVRR